jgi:hypothetical protein
MTDTSYGYPSAPPVPGPGPMPSPVRQSCDRRRGATYWGVMLIVLGAAFLAAQFVPGVSWWMLWPLIVVVAGLAQMVSPATDEGWSTQRFLGGMGTVLFGAVLLGNTTGYVAWTVWVAFISLWPALLIALGLSVIGHGVDASWLRVAARLVVWATLALAVYVSLTGAALGWVNRDGAVINVPGVGANGQTLNITIEPGVVPSIRTW